jgi:DNA-binding transcriptional LysR family regulator
MRRKGNAIDWDDFRFFLAVTRAGTLSGAAEKLGVEQSTVSRRIERLEKALKTRLFVRKVTGYVPTRHAEKLVAPAEVIETTALTARADISEQQLTPHVVRIGAPDGFGSIFLAPRLRILCDQIPNLHIELVATARAFSLTKREADIAFSLNKPTQGRIVSRKLTDYDLGLYASRSYLDRAQPILVAKDLRSHHFIGYIEDLLFAPELNYLPFVAKDVTARLKSGNLVAQWQACLSGAGIAVLPVFMVRDNPELQRVLPNQVNLTRTFYMQVHEDSRHNRFVREVADFVVNQVRSEKSLFKQTP